MINLKAELLKKQHEYKDKNNSKEIPKPLPWKKNKEKEEKSKRVGVSNKGVEDRNNRDLAHEEENNKLNKVQSILEAKTRMYEKLTSGEIIPDKDDAQMFMVDFEQKSIDAWRNKAEKGESSKPDVKVKVTNEVQKVIDKAKDEWVEYVDSLGRTRTCKESELHLLQKIDKKLDGKGASGRTLMSEDMRREEEREQWEEEERSKMEEGPLHYENLRDGEVRELGVGYYSFSGDAGMREEQMRRLGRMREETEEMKRRNKEKKEKQKSALETRLEKVRQRRVKKLLDQGREIPQSLKEPVKLEREVEEEEPAAPVEEDVAVVTTSGTREWDEGKGDVWSPAQPKKPPTNWKDPREERLDEFAPPSSYFQGAKRKNNHPGPLGPPGPPGHSESKHPKIDEQITQQTMQSNPHAPPTYTHPPQPPYPNCPPFNPLILSNQHTFTPIHNHPTPNNPEPPNQPPKPSSDYPTPNNPIPPNQPPKPGSDAERIQRLLSQVSEDLTHAVPPNPAPKPFTPTSKPISLKVKPKPQQILSTKSILEE
uniref:coiled-coil domain-containing protein 174-like n=1 Tax=Ciona intestinalis TaxID=7719 RepID=UPI000180B5CB|nr:coiled-coil domain-containing protein 174-like [Ciona intestinalis]|eukprot:XP_009860618.1 coiled-coil domain-containing protein 174-like [Ciona intestinalis]